MVTASDVVSNTAFKAAVILTEAGMTSEHCIRALRGTLSTRDTCTTSPRHKMKALDCLVNYYTDSIDHGLIRSSIGLAEQSLDWKV